EYRHTRGVEVTTGPLGQGLANAVGMAMAARRERGLFDPDAAPGQSVFDHFVYVLASDGDIEEGVTSEASSIAGRQQLGNLVAIKQVLGFDPAAYFAVEPEVLAHTRAVAERGKAARAAWEQEFEAWAQANPERKALLDRARAYTLPDGWTGALPSWDPDPKG